MELTKWADNPNKSIKKAINKALERVVEEFNNNYLEHDDFDHRLDELNEKGIFPVYAYDEVPEDVEIGRRIIVDGKFYTGIEGDPAEWRYDGFLPNVDLLFIDTEEHWENLGVRPEGVIVYHTDTNKLWFWEDDDTKILINDTEHPDGEWTVTDTVNENNLIDWIIDFEES